MNATLQDLQAIEVMVDALDPRSVAAEVERMKAGVPGWKPRIGGRSAESASPSTDKLDGQTDRLYRGEFVRRIERARADLAVALKTQRDLLFRLDPQEAAKLAEEEVDGTTCANPNCCAVIVPPARVLGGRCRPCHEYRRDHDGTERPRDLCDRSTEKGMVIQ